MIADQVTKPATRHVGACLTAMLAFVMACSHAWAAPIAPWQAERAVSSWLAIDGSPLEARIGCQVVEVQAYPDGSGNASYYIVKLSPSGFAIVAADDRIEPIVAFSSNGEFDPSQASPLGDLLSGDLSARPDGPRRLWIHSRGALRSDGSQAARKWARLLGTSPLGITGPPSDLRVTPFIGSQWDQDTISGLACYNYFTPPGATGAKTNYPCGCVATAMAQVMRYFEYPTDGVGTGTFHITVDGLSSVRALRGGDGQGGPYDYESMLLHPDAWTTDAQRRAIGALCHDAGVACLTSYESSGSSALFTDAQTAFLDTFSFSNAKFGYNNGYNVGSGLSAMVGPNLDARLPVMLAIRGTAEGHAVICDGYGYNLSTLYHHLNMGWSGQGDIWYNLPNIDTTNGNYSVVEQCLYNLYESGSGEIISGRVLTSEGMPIGPITVSAIRAGSPTVTAESSTLGVYGLKGVRSSSAYTVIARGYGHVFSPRSVSTGLSNNYAATSGNVWNFDLTAQPGWDCCGGGSAVPDADAAGVELAFTEADPGVITDLDVALLIDHSRAADVTAYLISPDGTSVQLLSGVGGEGSNFWNTVLDDEAMVPIVSGAAPFAGSYRPAGMLSAFDGMTASGVWKLKVVDGAEGGMGSVAAWCLRMTVTTDTVAPTCTVTAPTETTTLPLTFGIVFSEPVTGLTTGDIAVSGGTPGALSGSGASYTLPVTPSGYGTITCQVPAGAASDTPGNPNIASNTASVTYANTPPVVALTSPTSATAFGRTCASVSLAGTASDFDGITSVAWSSNRGGSGTCTGTTSWSVDVDLQLGVNVITLTATDGSSGAGTLTVTVTRTSAGPGDKWRGLAMVSLPVEPDVTDPKTVVGFDASGWLAYAADLGQYLTYPNAGTHFSPANPTPGRGFWARFGEGGPSWEGEAPSEPLCGLMPRQDQPYTIHLHAGWNLIGNPFASAVTWSLSAITVQEAGHSPMTLANVSAPVAAYAWGWDSTKGAYYLVCDTATAPDAAHTIEPWRGYWIKAKRACDLILPAP